MKARRPILVQLMALFSFAMLIPSVHGLLVDDHRTSRTFFYGFLLFGMLTLVISLATKGRRPVYGLRGQVVSLLVAFMVLPLMLAIPFMESTGNIRFFDAWFEMVSSLTTTGATIFDRPRDIPQSLHLWRATVGWIGGLLMWIAALAIFAPLNLGGFELYSAGADESELGRQSQVGRQIDPTTRLNRVSNRLVPIYVGATAVLWLGLFLAGEIPLVALTHAMSTLSTSGISPVGGIVYSGAGFWGEFLIFLFLLLALSHATFALAPGESRNSLLRDQELRFGLGLVLLLAAFLWLRHVFIGSDGAVTGGVIDALEAAWGGLFTIMSFMTTTGFESAAWIEMRSWSGLSAPGLMLIGLSVIGGGIATTAGGVKLLRVVALYRHGQREVQRLVHPNSIGGAGREARRFRRQGAQIAWVFVMIFAISLAAVMVLLSLTGVQFETAMVLAVAALSNAGPLADVAAELPVSYAGIPDSSKIILAGAMILGRMEALAIIALLNPEFWRR